MRKFFALVVSLALILPLPAFAIDQAELLQKMEALSKELESLKQQINAVQNKESAKEERISKVEKKAMEAAKPSWLEIGGDYRFRFDSLKGKVQDYVMPTGMPGTPQQGYDVKNSALMTNRLGLNIKAKATEDITVTTRLLMYKTWGHETSSAVTGGGFFGDRVNVFDGTVGHVPQDAILRVDQAYATWSKIAGAPVWFSVGRRPSTGGVPTNLRQNTDVGGAAGVPGLLVDYAFDGATLGVAPDIDALPGAYAKLCYGKGFDSGFKTPVNNIEDVSMIGFDVVPYDTDKLHVELNWNRAMDAFDNLPDGSTFGPAVTTNLGDIDWFGGTVTGKVGDLNLFGSAALSSTHPNDNRFASLATMPGLLYDAEKESHTGTALYLGARYDIKRTGTKIGAEYNHGSQYWITFVPASDDMWTGKLGTRGDVYEVYLIQELNQKPIAKRGKAFVRFGYQYYDFAYTGSNFWIGEPKKISDLNTDVRRPANYQMLAPIKNAHDIYATFNVSF